MRVSGFKPNSTTLMEAMLQISSCLSPVPRSMLICGAGGGRNEWLTLCFLNSILKVLFHVDAGYCMTCTTEHNERCVEGT